MKKEARKKKVMETIPKKTRLDTIIKKMHDFCGSQDNCNNCKFEGVCYVLLDIDIPADHTPEEIKALLMEMQHEKA